MMKMEFNDWKPLIIGHASASSEQVIDSWADLHAWDSELMPTEDWVAHQKANANDEIASPVLSNQDVADKLIEGWVYFHAGNFAKATSIGLKLGPIGHYLASSSMSIYAYYADHSLAKKLEIFERAYRLAHVASSLMPQHANTLYMYGCNIGRWGEAVSKIKAMQHGVPFKFKGAMLGTMKLESKHVYARTGYAAFQGTIISQSTETFAKFTFGVSRQSCYDLFEEILADASNIPLPTLQYGNAILAIEGKKKGARAYKYIEAAANMSARDAMEACDIKLANETLRAM